MNGTTDSTMWKALAQALVAGESKSAAARTAGCSRGHLYRLLKRPEFQQLLESLQGEPEGDVDEAAGAGSLPANVQADAVSYLHSVTKGDEEGDSVRVQAAKALLTHARGTMRASLRSAPPAKGEPEAPAAAPKVLPPLTAEEAAASWRASCRRDDGASPVMAVGLEGLGPVAHVPPPLWSETDRGLRLGFHGGFDHGPGVGALVVREGGPS